MEWIINQLREHPEFSYLSDAFRGILDRPAKNRQILPRNSNECTVSGCTGWAIEYHGRRSDESCILPAFSFCRRL